MGIAKDKGNAYENKIAGIIRKKTGMRAVRDKRSGAAWHRRSDISTDVPGIHIECKAHETVKVKEFFRQADDGASFTQKPVVVFPMDDDDLTIMRFTDVLDLIIEIEDLRAELEDWKAPVSNLQTTPPVFAEVSDRVAKKMVRVERTIISNAPRFCRTGHIAGDDNKCMIKGCPYMRGAKKKKEKK